MTIARSILLFVLAAIAEIGGAWLIWQGVREQRGALWIGAGVVALGAYGFVATLQPDANFGRILAAYGGIFVAGSLLWGMAVDGCKPDRWDVWGAASPWSASRSSCTHPEQEHLKGESSSAGIRCSNGGERLGRKRPFHLPRHGGQRARRGARVFVRPRPGDRKRGAARPPHICAGVATPVAQEPQLAMNQAAPRGALSGRGNLQMALPHAGPDCDHL